MKEYIMSKEEIEEQAQLKQQFEQESKEHLKAMTSPSRTECCVSSDPDKQMTYLEEFKKFDRMLYIKSKLHNEEINANI